MSETAKQLFASLKESVHAVAPGLGDFMPEAKAEFSRMGTQGAMELASALFNGHAFVTYGPGQYPAEMEEPQAAQQPERQEERGGIEP